MSAVIQVNHLSKQYREVKAVNDISFTVNRGDVYGFLGQNGAGKSTTIRMLLTLIKPSAGSVELFGKNLYTHRKEILREIGAVIEKPDLYKYLTAYENLSLFARMSGVPVNEKKLKDQLEQVGLTERAHSKVRTYSQGMKQRLGIAIALIHDPQLIILDEPTNGLDPQGVVEMRSLIRRLGSGKRTVMLSSHLLNEVQQISDRVAIIRKGKLVAQGTVHELRGESAIVVRVTPVDAARRQLDRMLGAAAVTAVDGTLRLSVDPDRAADINDALVGAGIKVSELRAVERTLEEVFLTLTGEAA